MAADSQVTSTQLTILYDRPLQNHKVEGNEAGAANVKKERTWRQYMNRKGGFNRPLDPLKK